MNKTALLLASTALIAMRAFENTTGWKLDDDGNIVMKDGNPVWIDGEGKEMVVQNNTISRLNGENKTLRQRAEKAESDLKPFEGLKPDDAKKALETVAKIDQKKLIDAGEVDKVRDSMKAEYTGQIDELKKENTGLSEKLHDKIKSFQFRSSEFIQNRVAVPPEMFEATFGRNFKVENEKLVPYDNNGNMIYSKKNVGEVADFDEALELIVDAYPRKDDILKAPEHQGSGNNGNGNQRGHGRIVTRADFATKTPAEQKTIADQASKGELQIVD